MNTTSHEGPEDHVRSTYAAARACLAQRVDRDERTLHAWVRLEEDLDLTPLELVLVALDVEEERGVTIPLEALGSVDTVGELLTILSRSARPAAPRPRRERRRGATAG